MVRGLGGGDLGSEVAQLCRRPVGKGSGFSSGGAVPPLPAGDRVQCLHWVAQLCRRPDVVCMLSGWDLGLREECVRGLGLGFRVLG